jgi:hypothetical protein
MLSLNAMLEEDIDMSVELPMESFCEYCPMSRAGRRASAIKILVALERYWRFILTSIKLRSFEQVSANSTPRGTRC